MTCWAPVPEAATSPTGPGRTTLAKPSATPETIAVPQSGPITSTPASCAASLSATSCSTGHAVAEDEHARPGARSRRRPRRRRTGRARRPSPGRGSPGRARAARRRPVVARGSSAVRARGRAPPRAQRRVDRRRRPRARRRRRPGPRSAAARAALAGPRGPCRRGLDIERRGHGDQDAGRRRRRRRARLTCMSFTESAYTPGRSSTRCRSFTPPPAPVRPGPRGRRGLGRCPRSNPPVADPAPWPARRGPRRRP